MTLTAPSTTVAPKDKGRLNVGISASDTTIYVAPIYKTVNGVKTKQGFDTTSGECEISSGGLDERISFDSASVNATTKVTTLSGCVRGLPVTNTTPDFTGGTGRIWAKGASIKVIDSASYNQSMALKNAVNAFTAANSFAGLVTSTAGINMSGTTSYLRVPQLTTAQRIALAGANGMIVYDTDLSVHYQYISGAWTTFATGTVSNAANNTGGKVDLATAAENAAGTATDATSGSPNVIPTSIVKATSTGAVNGTVPMLNSAVMLDGSIGGTGVASPVLGAILIGGGAGLAMTPIGPGTSGQVPVSNGTTLAMAEASTRFKTYKSTTNLLASKDAVGNTASETAFTTTYTIPANFFLATGDAMFINLFGYTQSKGSSAGSMTLKVKFGSTVVSTIMAATMTDNTEQPWNSRLRIVCATQGASGKLYVDSYVRYEGSSTKDYYTHAYDSNNNSLGVSFDTTGSASLTVTCTFSLADAANYCVLDWMNINKISATAF